MRVRTAQGPGSSPDQHSAADLQLVVRPEELTDFDQCREAEHLRRLEADQALTLQLSAEGFNGPAWRDLSAALAEYGFAVMRAWISNGIIVRKCRERGLPTPVIEKALTYHDVEDLTQDVVAEAVVAFRDRVLATARWNPSRGASLATFFVGMCLNKYPNIRRGWERQQVRWGNPESLDLLNREPRSAPSAEAIVLTAAEDRDALQNTLAHVKDETNRTLLTLRFDGYGIDEIAELMGFSYKQVESRLYRLRLSLRRKAARQWMPKS